MHVVLIETGGNQAYIFATNKLSENVGASHLIVQVGTEFVQEAVGQVGGRQPSDCTDPTTYPEYDEQHNPVEVIYAVSGKALILVRDAQLGRKIVQTVTLRALKEVPGLEVRGVVSERFDFNKVKIHDVVKDVHEKLMQIRSRLPGPNARFPRLPFVGECTSSGLPAACVDGRRDELVSRVTQAKRAAAAKGLERIRDVVSRNSNDERLRLPNAVSQLEDLGCEWLAVVHADGNGLGQAFLNFDQLAKVHDNRQYVNKLRNFSLALDECTRKAFVKAVRVFRAKMGVIPIVPLVLGGDDLTVVCDGQQALKFISRFICCFEEETRQHSEICTIDRFGNGATICAGVAIIKPHFPFFSAYELAEDLLQSAKKVAKRNPGSFVSAVDYHILHDVSGRDLTRIRRELTVDGGSTMLVARPYVVTKVGAIPHRSWSDLECRVTAVLKEDDDGRRCLPNSMLHDLREALFLGSGAADARLKLVLERYRGAGIGTLLGAGGSLFWKDADGYKRTGLLDALDTAEFWKGKD